MRLGLALVYRGGVVFDSDLGFWLTEISCTVLYAYDII